MASVRIKSCNLAKVLKKMLIVIFGTLVYSTPIWGELTFPKTLLFIGKQEFVAELANTPARRAYGLMYRTELQDNQAMLFIFPTPRRLSFWMKNTKLPLDIMYFDRSGKLLEIKRNLKPCRQIHCPSYTTLTQNAKFAVEVRAGVVDRLHLAIGMKLYGCGLI